MYVKQYLFPKSLNSVVVIIIIIVYTLSDKVIKKNLNRQYKKFVHICLLLIL